MVIWIIWIQKLQAWATGIHHSQVRCVVILIQTFCLPLSLWVHLQMTSWNISCIFALALAQNTFSALSSLTLWSRGMRQVLCWSQSWTVVSVACLCSIGTGYDCRHKLASYPEVPPTAIIDSDINFSTGVCSVSAEDRKMDLMFDILHGNSLFPITFPKQCWTNYLF